MLREGKQTDLGNNNLPSFINPVRGEDVVCVALLRDEWFMSFEDVYQ